MTKKVSACMVLMTLLLVMTMAAFAAANWPGIRSFLADTVGGWQVNDAAIVTPTHQSHSSHWLSLEATEAYWAEEGLSVVLKVEAAHEKYKVCYAYEDGLENEEGEYSGRIRIDGETLLINQWRDNKEVISANFVPIGEGWTWYNRTDEGLFVIVTFWEPDAKALKQGAELTLGVFSENLQTGERENSELTLSLPPMTMQAGHK